jgi:hypothetical protein
MKYDVTNCGQRWAVLACCIGIAAAIAGIVVMAVA